MLAGDQCFAYAFFDDEATAAAAVSQLIQSEFPTERIGALMLDDSGVRELPMKHKTSMAKGIALGTLLGATAGVIALPGLGLLAIGSAFAAFEAAAIGGVTGTLAGAMGGLGFWKDEVDFPHAAFERGAVLIGVLTSAERSSAAKQLLSEAGGDDVRVASRAEAEQELHEIGEQTRTP